MDLLIFGRNTFSETPCTCARPDEWLKGEKGNTRKMNLCNDYYFLFFFLILEQSDFKESLAKERKIH